MNVESADCQDDDEEEILDISLAQEYAPVASVTDDKWIVDSGCLHAVSGSAV